MMREWKDDGDDGGRVMGRWWEGGRKGESLQWAVLCVLKVEHAVQMDEVQGERGQSCSELGGTPQGQVQGEDKSDVHLGSLGIPREPILGGEFRVRSTWR